MKVNIKRRNLPIVDESEWICVYVKSDIKQKRGTHQK
jgi:hypothetical protein